MNIRPHWLWVAVVPALLVGCDPEIPQDPEPSGDRVSAVFDPATSTIPLPSTAALEEDGTLPNLAEGGDDAENDFLTWLGGLHGWSESTPITFPFSGELDPETVNTDTVKMWQVTESGYAELEIQPVYVPNDEEGTVCNPAVCKSIIMVVPAQTPDFGATYAAVVTKGVESAGGQPVTEPAAIFFAASTEPLVVDGEVTVSVLEDDPAQANQLEGLRQLFNPAFEAAAEEGISRPEVASATVWSVSADPFTVLDPDTATLPIPNDIALETDRTFPAAALSFCGGPGVTQEEASDDSCDAPSPDWKACETSTDCDQFRESGDPAAQCVSGRCVFTRCAQGQFDTYLDKLHGWPTTTPITLPVTQPIDEATLTPENVQLWKIAADGTASQVEGITVSMAPCGDQILITPPAPMEYAAQYFAFATKDVESTTVGPTGEQLELTPSAPILLAIMPHDPAEAVGDCTPDQLEQACDGGGVCGISPTAEGFEFKCFESTISRVGDADAAAVMAVRPVFRGAVNALEAASDVEWSDLAAIWKWTTWTDTFVVFDPTAGQIPFPHTLLTTGCPDDQPICRLPEAEGPTGAILDELRKREGFSSTATNWIPTLGPPLQADTVTQENVLFAEADVIPPPLFPADEYEVSYDYGHILIDFLRPLKPDTLVAGLTTTGLMGSNGFPAQPTPAFVFLRSEFPLVDDDGNKTVAQIPDNETAALLEASREEFEQLFLVALLFGYGRDQVNNAWAYVTGHTYRPLQRLRALTLAEIDTAGLPQATPAATPNVVSGVATVPAPDEPTLMVDVSNVEEIHWDVEFDTFNWLSAETQIVDRANLTRETVGVSLFVPKDNVAGPGGCEPPYNVVIAQHGNTGFRKNYGLALANQLAAEPHCLATVAMDLPLHGSRVPGVTDQPASTPMGNGDGFISANFPATVALFKQATIDLVVLTQMIKGGAFNGVVPSFSDATSQVGYVGTSLGSFVGVLYLTIDPTPAAGIINVGGGKFSLILEESETFGSLLTDVGLMTGTFETVQALHFVQWLGEHVDPYTFAPYTIQNPLAEVTWDPATMDYVTAMNPMAPKNVLIQMVQDETVVPNSSTELLARTMGVDLTDTTFPVGTDHGFIDDMDPTDPDYDAAVCARMQVAQWISSSFAGMADLPASLNADTCITGL